MTDYPRTPRINLPLVPDGDQAWGPAMRQAMTDLDNAVPWKARRHVLAATPSLGFYQTANLDITLTESCELISTLVDRECWVRIYGSAEARTRDADRQPDTPAPKGRGLYGQTHPYPPDDLTTQWSSAPFFHNLDPTIGPTAYIAVTNLAVGYEGPINLDFEFLPQEQFLPSGPQGETGLSGRALLVLTAPPTGAQGQDGDGAIDKIGKMFYGPKSGGAWPAGVSLQGPPGIDGKQLRSGTVDPTPADGVDGEFYYNYISKYIFGPKAAGAWPAGVSLVGPAGGGGGTWTFYDPDLNPPSPSSLDDEFNGASLDVKWTSINWSSLTAHELIFGQLHLNGSNLGRTMTGAMQPLPAGDFTVVIKGNHTTAVNGWLGIVLADGNTAGSGNQQAFILLGNNNLYVYTWTNYNTIGSSVLVGSISGIKYLRISRSGTIYTYSYSLDGRIWTALGTATPSFTPTHVGVQTSFYDAGATDMYFEYFRYYATSTPTLGGMRTVLTT